MNLSSIYIFIKALYRFLMEILNDSREERSFHSIQFNSINWLSVLFLIIGSILIAVLLLSDIKLYNQGYFLENKLNNLESDLKECIESTN